MKNNKRDKERNVIKKMKAIDMKELLIAMKDLEEERGIKKDYLLDSLEMALVTEIGRAHV